MKHKSLYDVRQQYLRRKAGGQFANFGGGAMEENPFLERRNFAGMAGGAGMQDVRGQASFVNIVIKNSDPAHDLTVSLFGANNGLLDAFDGIADVASVTAGAGVGLDIKVNGKLHEVFKRRTVHKPFLIEGLRVQYPSEEQLAENWTLVYEDNNEEKFVQYYPSIHINAGQQQSRQVDDRSFSMLVNGDSSLRFKVLRAPSANQANIITIGMNVRAITDSSELLTGKSPLGISGSQLGGADLY